MKFVLVGDISPLFIKHKSEPLVFHKSEKCRINYRNQLEELQIQPLHGPLHLEVTFYLPLPLKSNQTKKKALQGLPHTSGTKVTYLLQFIEFLRQEGFYHDDCSIASLEVRKVYSDDPRTEFTLVAL